MFISTLVNYKKNLTRKYTIMGKKNKKKADPAPTASPATTEEVKTEEPVKAPVEELGKPGGLEPAADAPAQKAAAAEPEVPATAASSDAAKGKAEEAKAKPEISIIDDKEEEQKTAT